MVQKLDFGGRTRGGREGRKGVEISTETEREAIGGEARRIAGERKSDRTRIGEIRLSALQRAIKSQSVHQNYSHDHVAGAPALLISVKKNCISDQYDSSLHQTRSDPSCRFDSLFFFSLLSFSSLPVLLHRSLRWQLSRPGFWGVFVGASGLRCPPFLPIHRCILPLLNLIVALEPENNNNNKACKKNAKP